VQFDVDLLMRLGRRIRLIPLKFGALKEYDL
jgi:hypothetical protein